MSLRTLPPEQKVDRSRWRRLRYVPLCVLAGLAAVAAVIGATQAPSHPPVAPDGSRPAAVKPTGTKTASGALPAVCRPSVESPKSEPWLGSADTRAASEKVWAAHAKELSKPYVAEQDGWYDWGDVQANNFSQALGRQTLSVDQVNAWHARLADLRDRLKALGIPLYIVVAPAKWDVYPQELPVWAQDLRGSNSLDQLLARSGDLPIVDVRAPLREASRDSQTFSHTNSHWTDYGAYVAWSAIASCLAASDHTFASLSAPPIAGIATSAERNEFTPFGVAPGPADWTSPVYASPLQPVSVRSGTGSTSKVAGSQNTDMLALPVTTRTDSAATPLSALLVRDSFGNALSVPVQQAFATTWQVRHNYDDVPSHQPDIAALAEKDRPSVVILEFAERYLSFTPAP